METTTAKPLINKTVDDQKSPEPVYERLFKLAQVPKKKPEKSDKAEKPSSPAEAQKKHHRGKPIYEALSALH